MKQYAVVRLHKNEDAQKAFPERSHVAATFSAAIAAMNQVLKGEQRHQIECPRFEQPLRVELNTEWLELWIINSPSENDTNIIRSAPGGDDFRANYTDRTVRELL